MGFLQKVNKYYKLAYLTNHFPSSAELLFSNKKAFVYYGYLGDNNFGDELVYDAAKENFRGALLIPVRKFMPLSLKLLLKFRKHRISGVVIGGGTLIGPFWHEDIYLGLVKLGIPVYVHGTGVHANIAAPAQWSQMLSKQVYGGVRGPRSVANLSSIYKSQMIGDAAFRFFENETWQSPGLQNKKVLINLGTHFEYEGQQTSRKAFEGFLESLINEGYTIDYMPFHENDMHAYHELKSSHPQVNLIKQPKDYQEALQIMQRYCFAFGERLHFTVMAIMAKTPFLSINYAKKHFDLLESLNLSHTGIDPFDANLDAFKQCFESRKNFNWNNANEVMHSFKNLQQQEAEKFIQSCNR